MRITYENYDRLQEQLEKIPNQSATWLPSEEELNTYVIRNPKKFIEFLLWLTFTTKPESDEEKSRFRVVNKILYDQIAFID